MCRKIPDLSSIEAMLNAHLWHLLTGDHKRAMVFFMCANRLFQIDPALVANALLQRIAVLQQRLNEVRS